MVTQPDFDGVDMGDPCAVYPVLERALNELLAGNMVATARFEGEEISYQQIDVPALTARIRELKRECRAKQGKPSDLQFLNFRNKGGWS